MEYCELSVEKPLQYNMTGKFKSPSPEWSHMKRVINDYELFIMTEGILYISIDGFNYTLKKGDFLFCLPLSAQEGYKSSECSFYWLHFLNSDGSNSSKLISSSEPYSYDKIKIPKYGSVKNYEKIIVMMKQLQDSVRSYENNIINNYLSTAVLCELSNQCHLPLQLTEAEAKKQQLYNDIVDYVKWYLNTNIKVMDIADHFGYNEKYLSHLFNSIKGMSLKQYILQEKIDLAKYMLTDTNDNISIIAENLGFNDCHNFMKVFKKIVGLTPTEYRNAYGKRLLYYV